MEFHIQVMALKAAPDLLGIIRDHLLAIKSEGQPKYGPNPSVTGSLKYALRGLPGLNSTPDNYIVILPEDNVKALLRIGGHGISATSPGAQDPFSYIAGQVHADLKKLEGLVVTEPTLIGYNLNTSDILNL